MHCTYSLHSAVPSVILSMDNSHTLGKYQDSIKQRDYRSTYLTSNTVGTKLAKTKRWRYLPQQRYNIQMLDASFSIRIIFTPQSNKFIQMMGPQNGPISCQIIKVIHDHSNKQVNDL